MKGLRNVISAAAIMLFLFGAIAGAQSTNEILLAKGWNLVSLPLQPTNTSTTSVLSGVPYNVVWAYSNREWTFYDPEDTAGAR